MEVEMQNSKKCPVYGEDPLVGIWSPVVKSCVSQMQWLFYILRYGIIKQKCGGTSIVWFLDCHKKNFIGLFFPAIQSNLSNSSHWDNKNNPISGLQKVAYNLVFFLT